MLVVLIKDAYEEFGRYLKDKRENEKEVEVYDGNAFVYRAWESLLVGEVIKVKKEEFIPCDVLVVTTSDPENKCYVETKGLDGETNLKPRQSFLKNIPNGPPVRADSYK